MRSARESTRSWCAGGDTPDDGLSALARHGHDRDELLARIVRVLQEDTRMVAAWLAGSFGRGEADAWSDLDLHVAVADDHLASVLERSQELFGRVGDPLLVQAGWPSQSQAGARFWLVVYPGALEVDWNIGPAGQAVRPEASLVLFDRAGIPLVAPPPIAPEERLAQADRWLAFFWAMAPIAVKYAGRGHTHRAVTQIGLLTDAAIALWRLVWRPDGPNPNVPNQNRRLEPELEAWLPRPGRTIDPAPALSVIRALCVVVEELHPALAAVGASIPSAMPGEVAALGEIAEANVRPCDHL
ncbi:MAG: nucleotidyltransferase domain-containing protein [Chloroflexi bacterium]|nr:nucleotidyltransferase domain-containing protein [Chloroflexota bacterium]